jgi:3'-phosphoadenosine 5'-phosphosulfate sulfotransferase (PAPS reductase)/FAD synthetase
MPVIIVFFIDIGFYIAEISAFRDQLVKDYHLKPEARKPLATSAL